MNLRDLADLAAVVSRHALPIVEQDRPPVDEMAEAFWVHSRRLKGEWEKGFADSADSPEEWGLLAEEFLVADLLSRVWAGTLTALAQGQRAIRPRGLALQTLGWNLAIRNQLLRTTADRWHAWPGRATSADLLRRKLERWTDLLLSPLVARYRVDEACFSLARSVEAGATYDGARYLAGYTGLWSLTKGALRASVPSRVLADSPRRQLHLDTVQAILSAFPQNAFQSNGTVRGDNLRRIFQTVRENSVAAPALARRLTSRPVHEA